MLASVLAVSACGASNHAAPIDPRENPWPAPPGDPAGSPYAAEPVPEPEAEEAWRSDAGRGIVAPVLADGRMVIATTTTGDVRAYSAEDGSRYWSYDAGGPVPGGAVAHGDLVLAATDGALTHQARTDPAATRRPATRRPTTGRARDGIHAISLDRGRRRWERPIGASPFAPLVVGDTVLVATAEGRLWALDASDGETIWARTLPDAAASSPVADGRAVYVPTTADTLYRVARRTGEVTGRAPLPGAVSAAPAVVDRTLVVPLYDGDLVALDLPSMTERWRAELGAPALASPVAAPDGRLFVLTTSAELWRIDDPAAGGAERVAAPGGAARSSLTVARDRVLVGRLDGTLLLLRPDGRIVWEEKFDDSIAAPVAVRDRAIYVPLLRGRLVKLR